MPDSDTPLLDGPQRTLYEALHERNAQLSELYMGAHAVLRETGIPQRLQMAAHCVRELMEKIPRIVDVAIQQYSSDTYSRWKAITAAWEEMCKKTTCRKPEKWQGEIDSALAAILADLNVHFTWYRRTGTSRADETRNTLRRLDPIGVALPPRLERENLKRWGALRTYFQNVSHHQRPAIEEEFSHNLRDLESFLLDRLRPKGFGDQDEIDRLLSGG